MFICIFVQRGIFPIILAYAIQFEKALLLTIGLLLNSYYFLIYLEKPEIEQYIRAGLIIVSGVILVYQRLYVSNHRPLSDFGPYTLTQDHPLSCRPFKY